MFSMHVLTFFFLRGNVLKKCRRDLNCSLDHSSSWVKNSIISPTKIEQHFGGFWNFETPLMLLSLSQKVVYSMRWKILFSSNIQWIPLVCMFFKIYLTLHINVQSGKIGSAWEWCHWIGKSTRAIGFYFYFSLLNIFGRQSSEQLHKIQPPACSVCMCSNLSWLAHFGEKICQNTDLFFFWFARNGILNSWGAVFQRAIYTSPAFLKHNSAEKKMQAHAKTMIRTCKKPWSEHAEGCMLWSCSELCLPNIFKSDK